MEATAQSSPTPAGPEGPSQGHQGATHPDSSPGPTAGVDDEADERELMLRSIGKGRKGKPSEASDDKPAPRTKGEQTPEDAAKPDEGTKKAASRPKTEDGKSADAESEKTTTKTDQDSIPKKAFLERLDRERTARSKLESSLAEKDLEIAHSAKAIELLRSQVQELMAAWQQGQPFDPRDAELRQARLALQARDAIEHNTRSHQERLEAAREDAAFAEVKTSVETEIDDAVSAYEGLITFEEVRLYCLKDGRHTAKSAAAAIYADKEAKLLARQPKPEPAPPVPQTIRAGPSGASHSFDDSEQGMRDWYRAKTGR